MARLAVVRRRRRCVPEEQACREVSGGKLHGDGSTPPPGQVVRPEERLSWLRTAGIGAQHVVAMFGPTFVFPLLMGLDPTWRS